MDDAVLDAVEAGVERLLAAYGELKSENSKLRQQLAALETRQGAFRERLDSLIARIEGAARQ